MHPDNLNNLFALRLIPIESLWSGLCEKNRSACFLVVQFLEQLHPFEGKRVVVGLHKLNQLAGFASQRERIFASVALFNQCFGSQFSAFEAAAVVEVQLLADFGGRVGEEEVGRLIEVL